MLRKSINPRSNWQQRVEEQGLVFHSPDGVPYWDESACYRFSAKEIDTLEAATAELQRLCLEAAQHIIDEDRFDDLRIPAPARELIVNAWEAEPPSIYGRMDLSYDGVDPPKLLEYNANTPTALLEASVIQWQWLRDRMPGSDQFNSIHEKLIAQWKEIKPGLRGRHLHFSCMENAEDTVTTAYVRDTAEQAGIPTSFLHVGDIGWNAGKWEFRDLDDDPIRAIFALYPWEWLLKDFGREIVGSHDQMLWIEPIWKMLWSNKALLAVLWELFPGHPNLLEAYLDGPRGMKDYVRKPLLSREGANVSVFQSGVETESTTGSYGREGFVWQALAPEAVFEGRRPVTGSWIVTDQGPAGIGIRESAGLVTGNLGTFVPHYF